MTDGAAAGTTGAEVATGAGPAGAEVGAGAPAGRGRVEGTCTGETGADEPTGDTGAGVEAAGVGTRVIVDGTAVTMAGWDGT